MDSMQYNAIESYDKKRKTVKAIEAVVYDALEMK
jgi:hypothetical protein